MRSRKRRLSPSLLAAVRKEKEGWLPFLVTRPPTALRPRRLAFHCQGIPTGNFNVGILNWWMFVESFLSSSMKSNSVFPFFFFLMQKSWWKTHYYMTEYIRKEKNCYLINHTSHPHHVLVLILWYSGRAVYKQLREQPGPDPGSMPALRALWDNQNCLAKQPLQKPLSLQKMHLAYLGALWQFRI